MWTHVGEEDFAHHKFVVSTTYRVGASENRIQDTVGILAGGLIGARSIKGPDGRLLSVGNYLAFGTQFGGGFLTINPDVLSLVAHTLRPLFVVPAKIHHRRNPSHGSSGLWPNYIENPPAWSNMRQPLVQQQIPTLIHSPAGYLQVVIQGALH